MTTPLYSASDYLKALQSLLPRGRIWPRDADAVQTKVLYGLSVIYERSTARAAYLLQDAFPASTYELLTEWESTVGLPDYGDNLASTAQGRRAAVVGRLTAVGGQSATYFKSIAASLGYAISVTNHAPFRCGQSRCGQQLGGEEWFFRWTVNASLCTATNFRSGQSGAGESLSTWGNAPLERLIQKYAPAHTIVSFSYT